MWGKNLLANCKDHEFDYTKPWKLTPSHKPEFVVPTPPWLWFCYFYGLVLYEGRFCGTETVSCNVFVDILFTNEHFHKVFLHTVRIVMSGKQVRYNIQGGQSSI